MGADCTQPPMEAVEEESADNPPGNAMVDEQPPIPTPETVDISLTNRSRMSYPILLGREYLLDRAIVDVSRGHIQDLQ